MQHFFRLSAVALLGTFVIGVAQAKPPLDIFGGNFTPPGQNADFVPPGQDLGFIPPGQNPDFIPPGQNEDDDEISAPPGACVVSNGGPDGRAGKSHVAHVNYSMVDSATGDFIDDETSPWARMTYFWSGAAFDFVFNAHNFTPVAEPDGLPDYVLTYQPEPMPSAGVMCLGDGEVNDEGDIHIANSVELDSNLPAEEDTAEEGASLVLVVAGDVDCDTGEMTVWEPENYLFTTSSVVYEDTNLE